MAHLKPNSICKVCQYPLEKKLLPLTQIFFFSFKTIFLKQINSFGRVFLMVGHKCSKFKVALEMFTFYRETRLITISVAVLIKYFINLDLSHNRQANLLNNFIFFYYPINKQQISGEFLLMCYSQLLPNLSTCYIASKTNNYKRYLKFRITATQTNIP